MTAITFSQFRRRLDESFEQAEEEAVFITRADGHDRVLISKLEYESLLETSHLLSTAANANRLAAAMSEIDAATLTARALATSGLVGLWSDRADLPDSPEYARQLRRHAEQRLTI